ncbi:hypothetical protein [Lentzea sp. NPDC004782]|uniref:hypothetical protein n=1 Tax=Lentzea sp. NPDC004782 TaxID=3154458 RepID=UPI0033B64E17
MVGTQHADAGVPLPDVDVLVAGIRELVDAARTLRQMNVTGVQALPPRLVQACRELLDEVDASSSSSCTTSVRGQHSRIDAAPQSVVNNALREVPLRRLLLQVVLPGETFTVPEVVARLAKLGKQVDPAKVSNALGYQVDRGQLVRERKGLYTYPVEALSADVDGTTVPGNAPAAGVSGSVRTDRRQQGDDHGRRTVAVRGQEDRRDSTTAGERREAG